MHSSFDEKSLDCFEDVAIVTSGHWSIKFIFFLFLSHNRPDTGCDRLSSSGRLAQPINTSLDYQVGQGQ